MRSFNKPQSGSRQNNENGKIRNYYFLCYSMLPVHEKLFLLEWIC